MTTVAAAPDTPVRSVRPPRILVLWGIALAGVGLAAATIALGVHNDGEAIQIALLVWISLPYVLVGLVAWWRRPASQLGVLMVAGGLASGLSGLQFSQSELVFTVGSIFDILPAAVFLHVYLAFPDGRLRSGFERALVLSTYVAALGLQLVKMALGSFPNLLQVTTRPDAALAVERVQLYWVATACLAGLGVLAARRRAGRPRRRSVALLIDSFALGLVMIAFLFVVAALPDVGLPFVRLRQAMLFVIGLSPIVFLIGLLDARLARSAIGDLVVELRGDLAPAALEEAIARTLRDPSLTLAYWLPDYERYADLEGRPVDVPTRDGRATTLIDRGSEHVAVLLHDPALDDEPELLDAVGAAAAIALENARLQAELAARLEEVKDSRARAIGAAQEERKRLERNLHDGAQQRLVALSLQLSLLERQLAENPEAGKRLDEVQRELALSLEELRDLARGIHPAVLSGYGLAVALEQVAARAPCPVRLDVRLDERLPEPVEVAAYYVVTESLANMAKHAQATKARVGIVRVDGDVVVEVEDNGVGGADTEKGSGLRGLADRVEALGGRMRVWTPVGGGTRVKAEIPCA